LSIVAADTCRATLPDEAMRRQYRAVLTQDGPRVTSTLEDATFYQSGSRTYNAFHGRVEPDRLTFQLVDSSWYYYYWYDGTFFPGDLIEQLPSTSRFFTAGGSAVLNLSGNRRSGTLSGIIRVFGGPPGFVQLHSCAASHLVELTR
jgi:hypothetical protein